MLLKWSAQGLFLLVSSVRFVGLATVVLLRCRLGFGVPAGRRLRFIEPSEKPPQH